MPQKRVPGGPPRLPTKGRSGNGRRGRPGTIGARCMITLGLNAAFHDSSACLVKDGALIAAAEEERFTRIKHGKRPLPFTVWELPYHAVDFCLGAAGIELADVDHVAYSYDPTPLLRNHSFPLQLPLEPSTFTTKQSWTSPWEPLALAYVVNAERQLLDGAPHHIRKRFAGAKKRRHWQWHFVEHHLAHEASAFLAAPFEESAVMTLDGRGEVATTSYGHFTGDHYERIGQVQMPHSLGLLYEQVTDYLGFLHSSDEYKVMALASYGEPRYLDQFRRIMRADDTGHYFVDKVDLAQLFGPARLRGGPMEQRHFDIAHSLQKALEETVLKMVAWLHRETGMKNLAMAGGVALNCVMNARLRDEGPFENVWVQPAAGDAGTALGAALWVDWAERLRLGDARRPWHMDHAFLGPGYSDKEIEEFLRWTQVPFRKLENPCQQAAD